MQQKPAEDIVDLDLQQLIPLIDAFLELIAQLNGFLDVVHVGIHHDGVSVTIDDSQRMSRLSKVLGRLQDLTTF